jgi:hypothetical protein
MRRVVFGFLGVILIGLVPRPVQAQSNAFDAAVPKIAARFNSTSVRRGETVVWELTVELTRGWHTYPTQQSDPRAGSYVNKFRFPADAAVAFVGPLSEPDSQQKSDDGTPIRIIEGRATWTRTALVRPDAQPGRIKVPVRVTLLVCSDRCLPPKTIVTEAELTISDLPPLPVDPKYKSELQLPNR